MIINPFLIPRLNYDYSIKDLIYSIFTIKKNADQKKLEQTFNNKNIFFFNHARTGLRILLNSLGLEPNAKIGVQAFNCHTVFQAIKNAGFSPVFIDINNEFTIDIDDLKKKSENLDALIVTHTFGIPADFDSIKKISKNIPIIEDCAHSFLSYYKNKLTGTFGDASIFSFGQAKFPSIGSGGFVLINNKSIIKKFINNYKKLPSVSILNEIKNILFNFIISLLHKRPFYGLIVFPLKTFFGNKIDLTNKYEFNETLEFKSNKNLFFYKFKKYNFNLNLQKQNALQILKSLKIYWKEDSGQNYFMIPLLINNRESMIKNAIKKGIEFGKHFSESIDWVKKFGYEEQSKCTNFEQTTSTILSMQCHYNLSNIQTKRICDFLEKNNESFN